MYVKIDGFKSGYNYKFSMTKDLKKEKKFNEENILNENEEYIKCLDDKYNIVPDDLTKEKSIINYWKLKKLKELKIPFTYRRCYKINYKT